MANVILAEMDLSAGLKPVYLDLPKMEISIGLDKFPDDLAKASEKLIMQALIEEAYASLNRARKDFADAIMAFDQKIKKDPPTEERDVADLERTINTICRQIVEAQQARAEASVMAVWDKQVAADEKLKVYRIKCVVKIALRSIVVAGQLAAIVASHGAAVVAILKLLKNIVQLAKEFKNFARDRDATLKALAEIDETLTKLWNGQAKLNPKGVTEELLTAVTGFGKSIKSFESTVKEYDAKIGMINRQRDELYKSAQEVMKCLKDVPDLTADAKINEQKKRVTDLLDKIGDLSNAQKECEKILKLYEDKLAVFQEKAGKAVRAVATTVQLAKYADNLVNAAEKTLDLAMELA